MFYNLFYSDEMKIWMPQPFRGFFIFCWAVLNPLMLLTVIITLFLDRVPSGTEGEKIK